MPSELAKVAASGVEADALAQLKKTQERPGFLNQPTALTAGSMPPAGAASRQHARPGREEGQRAAVQPH